VAGKQAGNGKGKSVIDLLMEDHREVEQLFDKFEGLDADQGTQKQTVVAKLIEELTLHTTVEEKYVYPPMRDALPQGDKLVNHANEEHKEAEDVLNELSMMDVDDDEFDGLVQKLQEIIADHVEEEEQELFPKFEETLGKERMLEIGAQVEEAKKIAKKSLSGGDVRVVEEEELSNQ
jgi:hemerythrin superfamily protein